jgi:glycosyltransferase involved in cell wall biosynthesis
VTRPVVYTGDIFRLQARGGITRYFREVIARLHRPAEVAAGFHQSLALAGIGAPVRSAGYLPQLRGMTRPRAALNAAWDRVVLGRRRNAILHPTYYRDPRSLPGGHPVVATVYDMAHERFPDLFRRRAWSTPDPAGWKGALCARADRIVCISEATKRDLIAYLGVPEAKLRVIHAGAPDWTGIEARSIRGVREPFFLWVGERHTYKNFSKTFEAWAGSRAAAETQLVCVGAGPFMPAERGAIVARGAAARVIRVACPDGELRWAYERAAGLLYTSLCEGFGLPVLEAMSGGCPVVASRSAALPEVAGDDFLEVDPTDRESIAAGIERCLLEGRDPRRTEAARARAAAFDWERTARGHEALYGELD